MPGRTIALLLFSALALLNQPCLAAQSAPVLPDVMDMTIEDLMNVDIDSVFGASGYKQNVTDAPASIAIVTAGEIQRYGYRTLADILRNVPGFYVTSDRVSNYIGVRGFGRPGDYNSRILLLVDGHRISDPVTAGTSIGTDFPIDIDLIERVEVIRGPNSSVYIAGALLGVVNVVTKRPRDALGLTASGEVAGYGTYKTRLTFAHQTDNGLAMLFSGSFFDSHGPDRLYFKEFDTPFTNNGIAQNANGAQSGQEFAKLTYRGFTLEGAYGSWRQDDPTASYLSIFNAQEPIRLMSGYFDLSYDRNFGGNWGYTASLYYDNARYHGTYPYDESLYGGASYALNQDLTSGQDIGASIGVSKRLPLNQTLILGSEYRDNFQQNQSNYDTQPFAQYLDSRRQSTLWGVHIQDQIALRRNLFLDLGLSYDRYSTFGGTTNPRAALIYQPREGTSLKFLYAQSFRAPTAFELYYSVAESQQSNPNLKPETARTMEVVWEQSLKKGFSLEASGYYYPIRGLISAETDPASGAIVYQNSQRLDLRGAEITLKRQSKYGLEAALSLNLQNARDLDNPGALFNSPKVLTQASLSVPLFKGKLFASMDLQYISKRRTLAGDFAKSYFLPNFTFHSSPKQLRGWELSASVYNAFNGVYGDPASIAHVQDILYQDGRNFRLKFTYHF